MKRWARQTILPELGEAGQLRLLNATVLCIGTGALGSPATMYLAAAGVGKIIIADPDVVETSNLQRQILHGESTCGEPKTQSAAARLLDLNPQLQLVLHHERFTPENAYKISEGCDLIVDGSDNFPTRFLTNDVAFFKRIPLIHAAIHRFEGQMTVFAPHLGGPCYRCLLPNMPAPGSMPSCAEAGVIGALPGIMGSLQAMEALKLLAQMGEPPLAKLLCYDALSTSFRSLTLRPDPECRLCGKNPSIHNLFSPETSQSKSCSMNTLPQITVNELHELLSHPNDIFLIDVREPDEHAQHSIVGSNLIPLGSVPTRLAEIPHDRPIIVHCKAGGRSTRAAQFLLDNHYANVTNVTGGMDAWLHDKLPTL